MTGSLKNQTVLVIGRGGGLARAVALAAQDAGAQVIAAGRSREALAAAYAGEPGIGTETSTSPTSRPSPPSASGSGRWTT
jgi:NAD(P)-dependent dehydrogenase (short-subunit alcohol dehydrogenase family)